MEHGDLVDEYKQLKEQAQVFKEAPFFFFEPYGQQTEFLEHPAQIRLITGGNRTGKSTVGVVEVLAHCMGFRHDGTRKNLPTPPVDILAMVNDRRKAVDKILMK